MVRGARLNGSDWSESRCLKRRVDPWGHLCSSCNYSVIPCDSGPVHHLFTAWQSHLLVHTLCESDNIRESRKKGHCISAGQDKRHLLTGSVIKMDMMGQRNSSGAPESNSSSSLRSDMCKNLTFLIMIYGKHLTLVSSSPVLT